MNRLVELRKRPLPDDVIGAVFVYAGRDKLPSDLRRLQSFFYELSKEPEYRDLFKEIEFSADRYPFPFSAELEPALGRLQNRGIINAFNPAFDWYGIEQEGRALMQRRIQEKFTAQQRELLERAGERLREASAPWPAPFSRSRVAAPANGVADTSASAF